MGCSIPKLGELIADSWERENALKETFRKKFPDRDEEVITELFHAELESELDRLTKAEAAALWLSG
jgi:hypothetical protein